MLDWIWSNKEWLFSGIGVVAAGTLVAAIRGMKRAKPELSVLGSGAALESVLAGPAMPQPQYSVPAQIEPAQVLQEIERAPLLQQVDVEKHYHGVAVEWEGDLLSANKDSETSVSILLHVEESPRRTAIAFDVNPKDYVGLGLLRKGDRVRVAGNIRKVAHQIIWLSEARIVR